MSVRLVTSRWLYSVAVELVRWSPKSVRLLPAHPHFGFSSFKAGQLEALLPALHGKDTYIRMATGGGQSFCMYLAPLTCSEMFRPFLIYYVVVMLSF